MESISQLENPIATITVTKRELEVLKLGLNLICRLRNTSVLPSHLQGLVNFDDGIKAQNMPCNLVLYKG